MEEKIENLVKIRTKVTKFFESDENFVRRKILSDENSAIIVHFENSFHFEFG